MSAPPLLPVPEPQSPWELPTSVFIAEREWPVHADYRDILHILCVMQAETDDAAGAQIALSLFYVGFDALPGAAYPEAWQAFCQFLQGGFAAPGGAGAGVKLVDWRQDAAMIAAEVNRVAGREIRAEGFVHWHTFLGWFYAVGEGQLATVVAIRHKRARGKKLTEAEREYYRAHKAQVEFATPLDQTGQDEKRALWQRLKDA